MAKYKIGNDLYEVVQDDGQFDQELQDGTKLRKINAAPAQPQEQFDLEKSQTLAAAYGIYSKVNPEQEARDRETSRMLDVPLWAVQAAPQTRTAAQEIAKTKMNEPEDWNQFRQEYPHTADTLSDPYSMKVAHDDINNLSKTEQIVKNISDMYPFRTYGDIAEGTKDVARSSLGFFQGIFENLARGSRNNQDRMEPEYKIWSDQGGSQQLDNAASFFDMVLKGDALKEHQYPAANSALEQYYHDVVRMSPQIGSQLLITGAGGPVAGGAFMFSQIAGDDYQQLRKDGVSPERALTAGIADASIQTPMEQFSLGKFMKMFKTTSREGKLLKEIGEVMGTEFLTEWAQQYPQAAAEIWAKSEGKDYETRAKMFVDDFAKTTAEGMYQGLVTIPYSVLGGAGKAVYQSKAAYQGEQRREKLAVLNEAARESKLRVRDPEVYAWNLNRQVQGTGMENVLIPAQALQEYFQDAAPGVAQNLGLTPEEYQEKLASGTDVSVPLGDFMAKFGGTEHFDKILPSARFNPEDMTAEEAKQYLAGANDALKQAAANPQALANLSGEDKNGVYQKIRDQLLASGTTKAEAEYGGKLVSMFADRMVSLGAKPEDLRSLGNILVQRGEQNSSMQAAISAPQFLQAISAQESGGNAAAYNADGNAYGKYQFQPDTWDQAAKAAGREDLVGKVPNEVSAADQDQVAAAYAQQLYQKYGDWRKVAIAWYAGDGAVNWSQEALSRKQGENGEYPSINDYADQVMARLPGQGSGSALYQYAGLSAENADTLALRQAQEMEQEGKDIEEIRRKTGWFKGMDDKWRFEIDDSAAKLIDLKGIETDMTSQISGILSQARKVKDVSEKAKLNDQADTLISELSQKKAPLLGNILDHPQLYQAYPWMKDIKVVFSKMSDGNSGSYDPAINTIEINRDLSAESQKRTLHHEIQHVLQEQENFARGGSPNMSRAGVYDPVINEAMEIYNKYQAELSSLYKEGYSSIGDMSAKDELKKRFPDLAEKFDKSFDLLWKNGVFKQGQQLGYEGYKRLAGEIEARDTAQRADYTSEKRNEIAPELRTDAIIMFRGETASQTDSAMQQVMDSLQEIVNGKEEVTVKNLRPDLEKYGGSADVNFIWGNNKKGLQHIGMKRGAETVLNVISAVVNGQISRYSEIKKTVTLEHNGYEAVLSLDEDGNQKTWLLTGWHKNKPDTPGVVSTQSGATQTRPTFSRSDLGAGLSNYSIAHSGEFFQTQKSPQGSIQFRDGKTVINLFQKANKSTLFHELGHLFLTDYMTVASMENAPKAVKRDWQGLKSWLKIDGEYNSLTDEEKIRVQEQFARGFEAYLREGKAPSTKLQRAFRAFRKWLTRLYVSVKDLGVELDPEVVGIMDRMLASEEEIREAQIQSELEGLDQKILDNLSPEEKEQYDRLKSDAHDTAVEILLAKRMAELDEENQKFLELHRSAALHQAQQELQTQPVYQAMEAMTESDTMKLSRQTILDTYGEKTLASLPPAIYSDTANLTADDAADIFGFGSGDEMLQAIAGAKPYNEALQDFIAADVMKNITVMTPEQIKEEAKNSLYNEDMLKLLSLERALLEDKLRGSDTKISRILTLADNDLRELLDRKRQSILDEQVSYLVANSKLGVEKRVMTSDGNGEYVFAAGYSRNHPWYSDILDLCPDRKLPSNWGKYINEVKENPNTEKQMPAKMREVFETVASDQLEHGFQAMEGEVPPNDDFRTLQNVIGELNNSRDSPREKLQEGSAIRSISEAELQGFLADRKAEQYARMRQGLDKYRSVVQMAKRTVEGRKYREAVNFRGYLASANKSNKKVQDAIQSGDMAAAQRYKDTATIASAMAMQSIRVKNETDRMFKYLERYARKGGKKPPNIPESYLHQIEKILNRFQIMPLSRGAEQDTATLSGWIKDHEASGDAAIPPVIANEAYSKHYKELTIEELRDMMDSIRNIETAGRNEQRFITDENKRAYDEIVAEVETNIYETHGIRHPQNNDPNRTKLENAVDAIKGFRASHRKVEFIVRALDGYKDQGPSWKYIVRPLLQSLDKETVLRREGFDRYQQIIKQHYGEKARQEFQKRFFFPELQHIFHRGLTKENIVTFALNWGNADNRNRVLDSYTNPETGTKLTEDNVQLLFSKMTKEDWRFVQDIWNFLDEYWPMTVEVIKQRTGVTPAKVDPAPFTAKLENGETIDLQGGYYPITYDPTKSEAAFSQKELEDFKGMFDNSFVAPGVRSGHTKARAERVVGRPLDLHLSVIDRHLTNVIHHIAFANAIRDVNKLVSNKRISRAIEQSLGREMYKQFKPWLLHIGYEYRYPMSGFEKILKHARMGATVVNMGLKFSTAFSQLAGITPMMRELGNVRTLGAMLDFHANPMAWKQKAEAVFEKSPMMQARMSGFDRDVRDMSKQLIQSGKMSKIKQSWFYLTGMFDLAITIPAWQAAYEKSVEEQMKQGTSFDEETARRYADGVIRNTQGSGDAINLSAIQRGPESHKLFTMFYSYFNVYANGLEEQLDRTKGIKDIPRLTSWMVYWTFLPALLGELLAGRGPDDDDEWGWWTLRTMLQYPLSAYIGIRDAASAMFGKYGYEMTPAASGMEKIVQLWKATAGKAAEDKDIDWEKVSKLAVETGGYWFHYPSKQLLITGENLLDYMTGNDSEFYIRDLFFRKPKERQ